MTVVLADASSRTGRAACGAGRRAAAGDRIRGHFTWEALADALEARLPVLI